MKRSKAAQRTRNCPPYEILHKLSSIDLYGDIDKQKRKRLRSLGIYEVELLIAQRKDISHREHQSSSTRKWSCNHAIFTKPSHTLYQPLLIVYSKYRLDEMHFITTLWNFTPVHVRTCRASAMQCLFGWLTLLAFPSLIYRNFSLTNTFWGGCSTIYIPDNIANFMNNKYGGRKWCLEGRSSRSSNFPHSKNSVLSTLRAFKNGRSQKDIWAKLRSFNRRKYRTFLPKNCK